MIILRKFQRVKENFICEKCGLIVSGNGYTNHCPKCLWSKHVDVNPGDRQSECFGSMKPISIQMKSGEYFIIHYCILCGIKKINKASKDDDFKEILKISNFAGNYKILV